MFTVVGVALTILCAEAAYADVFAARGAVPPRETRVDALVLEAGGVYTLIEQVTLRSTASQFVWLRPFRARPINDPNQDPPSPQILRDLATAAVRVPEYAEQIRSHPFGPSVLTFLSRAMSPANATPKALPPPTARPLEVDTMQVFDGLAVTSTITGATTLPRGLEAFLVGYGATLSEDDRRQLGRFLNRGWSILAAAVYDGQPSDANLARIGPLTFRFTGPASYPLLPRGRRIGVDFLFYTLASSARIPQEFPARSQHGALELSATPAGESVVTFSDSAYISPTLTFQLTQNYGLTLPEPAILTQTYLRPGDAKLDAISFAPPESAVGSPAPIAATRPGSPRDLLLCVLLGLAPLFLTPESWLVFWLQSQARDAAREGRPAFGVKLWAVWALGVGAYWFFTLEDFARVAALAPLLVGTMQLALPFSERTPSRVRARVQKRKEDALKEPPGDDNQAAVAN